MAASLSVEGCCEDEVDLLKIDDDQSASSTLSISPAFFTILEKVFTLPVEVKDDGNSGIFTSLVRPPGKHIPLFVQHCSLVFYDDSDLA